MPKQFRAGEAPPRAYALLHGSHERGNEGAQGSFFDMKRRNAVKLSYTYMFGAQYIFKYFDSSSRLSCVCLTPRPHLRPRPAQRLYYQGPRVYLVAVTSSAFKNLRCDVVWRTADGPLSLTVLYKLCSQPKVPHLWRTGKWRACRRDSDSIYTLCSAVSTWRIGKKRSLKA